MNDWRAQLNRLAVEFWCGVGDLAELAPWADAANAEMGEVHPEVWDLYIVWSMENAKELLLKIAKDVNGFKPTTWDAAPFAAAALKKALELFLAQKMSVQTLCQLVDLLDATFVIGLPLASQSEENPSKFSSQKTSWLGNLYNCCDWCDASWTMDNSPHLVAEAQRVLGVLANGAFSR